MLCIFCCTAKGESSVLMFLIESWWETKSKLQTIGPITGGECSTVELMWWCCVMTAVDNTVEWLLMAWIISIELDCVHFQWASWHYFHTSLNITGLCSFPSVVYRCLSMVGRGLYVPSSPQGRLLTLQMTTTTTVLLSNVTNTAAHRLRNTHGIY